MYLIAPFLELLCNHITGFIFFKSKLWVCVKLVPYGDEFVKVVQDLGYNKWVVNHGMLS